MKTKNTPTGAPDYQEHVVTASIERINKTFNQLSDACRYRSQTDYQTDCSHPDIDFKCMMCCVQNCPLLV